MYVHIAMPFNRQNDCKKCYRHLFQHAGLAERALLLLLLLPVSLARTLLTCHDTANRSDTGLQVHLPDQMGALTVSRPACTIFISEATVPGLQNRIQCKSDRTAYNCALQVHDQSTVLVLPSL